jgi:site-specific recombinase XerC
LAQRDNPDLDEYLFLTDSSNPITDNEIRHILRNLGSRAGVKKCYPHRFRHTMAIEYLRNGGDVFTLQRIGFFVLFLFTFATTARPFAAYPACSHYQSLRLAP